ncbi:MAG: AAA family ATPase [Sphaerochaeta sp.]|nr:AAA family ATPase [Sphaerochaeta sp.]
MKILELRFKNLNSLYGEWHIDFTESEYVYNGIFALTGPTGAGKSTILDAICLALYGSTPRLGRITQSSNDIMSRQTGECYAEVLFASQAGRFRCHWAHHRSRKKANGELQIPRHEISEATEGGKVLENKLTSVLSAVEEKTGMDFERFTRSILLAQGDFDTFLKATVEQKSKILEQITGTKIYSDISIGVHERLREEKNKLENLESETRGIPILSPEEELAAEENLTLSLQKENLLENMVSDIAKSKGWLTSLANLQMEIENLAEEETELTNDMLAFVPKRTILDSATKAATLEGSYATLTELRKQQKEEQSSLEKEEEALPALEINAKEGSETLTKAENQSELAKSAQQEAAPILKQVRAMDQKLSQLTTTIAETQTAMVKDAASIELFKKERETQNYKELAEQKKLSEIEFYCADHSTDKDLITELTGIISQIHALESKRQEVTKKTGEVKSEAKNLEEAEKALASCKSKSVELLEIHGVTKTKLQAKQEELSRLLGEKLLREYRAEKETLLLKIAYLNKVAELQEYRSKLEDGKECPLCGALEHPFAMGNVPAPDETEKQITILTKIISDAENLETTIGELVTGERDAENALAGQKQLESDALHTREITLKTYKNLQKELEKTEKALTALEQSVADVLKPYGFQAVPDDLSVLSASLRKRRDAWQEKITDKQNIENSLHLIRGEVQRLNGVIDTQESALQEKSLLFKTHNNSLSGYEEERKKLFGDKDADSEEEKLAKGVRDAEAKEKEARKACTDLLQRVSTSKTRIESLLTSLEKRKPALETKESLFLNELSSVGFSDEQQFFSSRLPVVERNALAAEAKALDDRQTGWNTRQKDRTERLTLERAKNITDKSLGEIELTLQEKQSELKVCKDMVADYKAKLKGNNEAKKHFESKQKAIEDQKRECAKWDRLHALIGSADGKKFRNFAQGLTFELMVGHANRQLAKMSDRYLLIRDESQPLELNVIDNYQAGEIRSTKNLSGGESFIVSLTLALGLSKMASRKVRVDSLFLDEGFGTLDEESLETALKTLSSLQQDGKLIGVISHVSAMQEMISTQITITPSSGGRSVLSGPGCSKVG